MKETHETGNNYDDSTAAEPALNGEPVIFNGYKSIIHPGFRARLESFEAKKVSRTLKNGRIVEDEIRVATDQEAWIDFYSGTAGSFISRMAETVAGHAGLPELAPDFAQETMISFTNAVINQDTPDNNHLIRWDNLPSQLTGIIKRKVIDELRKRKRITTVYSNDERVEELWDRTIQPWSGDQNPESVFVQHEADKEALTMLDGLSHNQRDALILFYIAHFSIPEIANARGRTSGAIKSQLFHGRENMKKNLG